MSGIVGILRFDGARVPTGHLEKLTAAMAARGPHGIGHWSGGEIALGVCMLNVCPKSAAIDFPYTNESASLVLALDARLDNQSELREQLRRLGFPPRNQSDSELVLRAYEAWGEDCPSRLLGDFAFAIWDQRRRMVFFARDRFGVKPLFYYRDRDFLAFASDDEALVGLPGVPIRPNDERIAYLLVPEFDGYDTNSAWLDGVRKVEPGGWAMVWRDGRMTSQTYWTLKPGEEMRLGSDEEYEDAFRSVFSEAVRRRLPSDGISAVMLSGGIDSASVFGAARHLGGTLQAISVVSDQGSPNCAETRNIRLIRNDDQHPHLEIEVPSLHGPISLEDLQQAAWGDAHPVANTLLVPAMVFLAASRSGTHVVLDGVDGDLVTYNSDRYIARLLRSGAWRQAWSEAQDASRFNTYLRNLPPSRLIAQSAWAITAPQWAKSWRDRWRLNEAGVIQQSLISPALASKLQLGERLREGRARTLSRLAHYSEQELHVHWLTSPGIARGMEGLDRVAARYGVEPRHPWSDQRLIEFYLRLPQHQKVRGGWTKSLLRRSMTPFLHDDAIWHSGKDHLGWPLTRRLMKSSLPLASDVLRVQRPMLTEYMDTQRMDQALARAKAASEPDLELIYSAMSIAMWLSRLVSRTSL